MLLCICKGSVNLSLTPGLIFSNDEPDSSYQSPAIKVTATEPTTNILSGHSRFAYEHLLTKKYDFVKMPFLYCSQEREA